MEPQLSPPAPPTRHGARNRLTALAAAGVVVGMVGMAYAAVPLYRIFCQVTGFGGTTQVAASAPSEIDERVITVRFNADTARDMPWRFRPQQRAMTLRVGERALAFYEAFNPSDQRIAGSATFNVTPAKAGVYFNKIECFCFTEQVLAPGQRADMPVSFFVDPAIADDPDLDDVKTITLSYTFFRVADGSGDTDAEQKIAVNGVAEQIAGNGVR